MTVEPSQSLAAQYQQIHGLVQVEFNIEEGYLEHEVPTFYITLQPNSKQAFLRLYRKLDSMELAPFLRKRDNRYVLQIVPKPKAKSGRKTTNIVLFFATMATLLVTGYLLSLNWNHHDPLIGAAMFSAAVMAIIGSHEMAHKLAANKHGVEATYPYFIPGIPPLGTFGAVIQQKSLAPNRDALFDLGMSGPVMGFIITIFVTIIGVQLSPLTSILPPNSAPLQVPFLFDFIISLFPPHGQGSIILLHPVAYAGYIGMIITMLNLLPTGMLDGGHVIRVLLGDRARTVISYLAILAMLLIGAWLMAILVFFLSRYPHPGSLDDVSQLSTIRKLAAVALIAIFVLTVAPLYTL
jgi:membrane-associated protease RseP (regulator of RpoE activity)